MSVWISSIYSFLLFSFVILLTRSKAITQVVVNSQCNASNCQLMAIASLVWMENCSSQLIQNDSHSMISRHVYQSNPVDVEFPIARVNPCHVQTAKTPDHVKNQSSAPECATSDIWFASLFFFELKGSAEFSRSRFFVQTMNYTSQLANLNLERARSSVK